MLDPNDPRDTSAHVLITFSVIGGALLSMAVWALIFAVAQRWVLRALRRTAREAAADARARVAAYEREAPPADEEAPAYVRAPARA